jgi:hypothetical protein
MHRDSEDGYLETSPHRRCGQITSAMTPERESIIAAVENAFACVRRDGGITLHESLVMDRRGDADALAQARRLDPDVPWTEIADADISSNPEIFSFLDFSGFRYYLPAYITWSLRHFDDSNSASSDTVVYALNPQGRLGDVRLSYFERFSQEQRIAVARFLRFLAKQEEFCDAWAASQALDNYWSEVEVGDG